MEIKIKRHIKKTIFQICTLLIVVKFGQCQSNNVYKPYTRWWWMDNAVDQKSIVSQLDAFQKIGIGGVEIVPIYGVKGNDGNCIPFLSGKWVDMLGFTIDEARKRNLGIYISAGSGWPLGGPNVSIHDAASYIYIDKIPQGMDLSNWLEKIKSDTILLLTIQGYQNGKPSDITGVVAKMKDKYTNFHYDSIYFAIEKKTRQKVKRASKGGEGFTMDHFSKLAINNYLNRLYDQIKKISNRLDAVYNDSYEVYGANWTESFFDDFYKIKEYDLRKYLPELNCTGDLNIVKRIKSDYREVLSEIMLNNFGRQFTEFAHANGTHSLNQAHGSPANLLDMYAAADIPEIETFGSSFFAIPGLRRDSSSIMNVDPDPNMYRFASSAAHARGCTLVSCETFTWLTDHFKTSWALCKPEVEQAFLGGVNHVIFHGSTYSPDSISWPGWLFYASVDFDRSNSLWPTLNSLNSYITNCQEVLQEGHPANDVAVYWPIHDIWDSPKGLDMPLRVHNIDEWLHPTSFDTTILDLDKNGYSLDFFSDKMLLNSKYTQKKFSLIPFSSYKTIVVPKTRLMPLETFKKILQLANNGLTVCFNGLPESVPGWKNYVRDSVALSLLVNQLQFRNNGNYKISYMGKGKIIVSATIAETLTSIGIRGEPMVYDGLKYIKRKVDNGVCYYVVNHSSKTIDKNIIFNAIGKQIVLYDPLSNISGYVVTNKGEKCSLVHIQLQPGETIFLRMQNVVDGRYKKWKYVDRELSPIALSSPWRLHFNNGGPFIPKDILLKSVQPWTSIGDSVMNYFSGSATYSTDFNLDKKGASDFFLHIDTLFESCKVNINGVNVGTIWSIPSRLRIGKFLKKGMNNIKITVFNLMANRIRYMDRNKIYWKKFKDINIVDIKYKPFDASQWPVSPSGISGGVSLIPIVEK